ncbi:MAG: 5-deoxy-glucuronate isomerase [Actinomycetota bacterium]|nr:5-deoxy-glucuronate isomerase [Actinomycetota bacterium]
MTKGPSGNPAHVSAAARVDLHRPAGTLASPPWALELTQGTAQWSWVSLRVLELEPGGEHELESGGEELLVLPLTGSCEVSCDGETVVLAGRTDVFAGPSDFTYVPRDAHLTISSERGGRFALPGALADERLEFRRQPSERTPVELRGAGRASRRVVNYCMAETFDADHLLVCEVVTPSGNWSSYPPHKHDVTGPGEVPLEELYYFEVAGGPGGPGFAYQQVYGTEDRPIELLARVGTGDVVLIPHGYHGPSMAPPGYDLYYLNVMAGPCGRQWLACDDPRHAWVRGTWEGQEVDERLVTRAGDETGDPR